jgi:hypothetical protein
MWGRLLIVESALFEFRALSTLTDVVTVCLQHNPPVNGRSNGDIKYV